jgi:hypothetical protein
VIGLAETERQSHHQIGPDVADDVLRDRLRVGKHFRHQVSNRGNDDIKHGSRESETAAVSYITHTALYALGTGDDRPLPG